MIDRTYLIIDRAARDILVVLTSIIASKSAFNIGRKVMYEKRSSLVSNIVKILIRKKDRDQVTKGQQGKKMARKEKMIF